MKRTATERRRGSGLNPLPQFFARHFADGTVTRVWEPAPGWRAIRVACQKVASLDYKAGQHVRIELRDPFSLYGLLRPIETMRTYTIWEWDISASEFELRAHLYPGDGIGLKWVRTVAAGDGVRFWGPQGDLAIRSASGHLFVGDETASVAFGPMMRSIGAGEKIIGVIEVENECARLPMPDNASIHWIYRDGTSPIASSRLADAVTSIVPQNELTAAYLAGEARSCQMVRERLIAHFGWDRSAIQTKPFWAAGKRGLH